MYFFKKYIIEKTRIPIEINYLILSYLPMTYLLQSIENDEYMQNGFWFKRIICNKICDIRRSEISYFDWYKIFHYKNYSMLIKYENRLVIRLLQTKTKEEIERIHMNNLKDCHKRNYMNYKY